MRYVILYIIFIVSLCGFDVKSNIKALNESEFGTVKIIPNSSYAVSILGGDNSGIALLEISKDSMRVVDVYNTSYSINDIALNGNIYTICRS